MYKKLFFLCFMTFSTLLFSAEAPEKALLATYENMMSEPGAAVFTPPDGWLFTDPKILPKSVKMMVVGKGKHPYPPSINLAAEDYVGTLKDYLKIVKEINDAQGYEWKDLGTIDTGLGKGNLSQVDTPTEWGKVRSMHVILPYGDKIYILTASSLQKEFANFYDTFFMTMQSFHVNPHFSPVLGKDG